MTPDQLSEAVLRAARRAVGSTAGPAAQLLLAPGAPCGLRRPPHGDADWSSGIALRLAGPTGRGGSECARSVARWLREEPGVERVEAAGAGFLNIWTADPAGSVLRAVLSSSRSPAPVLPEDPARDVRGWVAASGAPATGLLVQRAENPLFRVRYAHARSRALLRGGAALGLTPDPGQARLLTHRAEREVLAVLGEVTGPGARSVATTSPERPPRRRRTHRLLIEVADAYLPTVADRSTAALPHGPEKPGAVHRARLALAEATGAVLADGLHRIGVGAPEHL